LKKSSPDPLKKLYKKKKERSPLQLRLTLFGEGLALFHSDFACGEIGSRELRVPLPLSLHDVGADSISARLK